MKHLTPYFLGGAIVGALAVACIPASSPIWSDADVICVDAAEAAGLPEAAVVVACGAAEAIVRDIFAAKAKARARVGAYKAAHPAPSASAR